RFAGLVVTPRRAAMFRHIEFVGLADKRILLIIVSPEGDVQNRIITTDKSYSQAELVEAANILNQHFAGCSFADIRHRIHDELKELREKMSQLMTAALEAGSQALQDASDEMVISGERNLLQVHDLSANMTSLRKLFELFDQKTSLLQLLDIS